MTINFFSEKPAMTQAKPIETAGTIAKAPAKPQGPLFGETTGTVASAGGCSSSGSSGGSFSAKC